MWESVTRMGQGQKLLVFLEICLLFMLTTVDVTNCDTSCGGILNKTVTEGNLSSPGFPSPSTPNTTCVWYLLKDSSTFKTFVTFHLNVLHLSDPGAFLVIYNGNITAAEEGSDVSSNLHGDDAEIVANFTSNSDPRTVLTTSDVTTVVFYSGETRQYENTARFLLHFLSGSSCEETFFLWGGVVRSPLYPEAALPLYCTYRIGGQDLQGHLAISFSEFNVPDGYVLVDDGTILANLSGSSIPEDVFIKKNDLAVEFMFSNSREKQEFTAVISSISPGCLGNISLTEAGQPMELTLPENIAAPVVCQWHITVKGNRTGLVRVSTKNVSPLNRLLVSDGGSLFGSGDVRNTNSTLTDQVFIGSGRTMSIQLTSDPSPVSNKINLQATLQKFGGIFYNNGSLEGRGVDFDGSSSWYYYLRVPPGQQVELIIGDRLLFPATSIRCYDGGSESCPILADFRSNRPIYPVTSGSNQMLVVAKNLEQRGFFNATFTGKAESCNKISQGSMGQYKAVVTPVRSGNETCNWIIEPQNLPDSILMIKVRGTGLLDQDTLTIYRGVSEYEFTMLTARGDNSQSQLNLPRIIIPASTGARLMFSTMDESFEYNGNQTATRMVEADFQLLPQKICGGPLNSVVGGNLLSPFYPEERYPLNVLCEWSSTVLPKKIFYMTFNTFQINTRHCLTVSQSVNETSQLEATELFNGTADPGDLLLSGPVVHIAFSTQGIHHGLDSGQGFNISYRSLDCGGSLSSEEGKFSTPNYPKTVITDTECIWIISLSHSHNNSTSVYVVSFDIDLQSYSNNSRNNALEIRDGNSQHSPVANLKLTNGKSASLLSRTNYLWVRYMYKREDSSANSPGFAFQMNYKQHECSLSEQCNNGVCLQPDWRCNGVDDCGDMTDERNCSTPTTSGVAGFIVAICVIVAFALGVLLAFAVPMIYKRCRYPNYSQLRDIVSPVV